MIYCVEDDASIRELIVYTLKASGFNACGFSDASSFWAALQVEIPELILLDIMLPGEDGITTLKKIRLRKDTKDVPVIMATAKSSEYDKVTGLDSGADDYLSKPFGMMEMVSRVKALLRRTSSRSSSISTTLSAGNIIMDVSKHSVSVSDQPVSLTLKEYDLLKLLMENKDLVFSREQLLNSVWGIDFIGESRTVDVHVGTLRTKLGECGKYIETVRGVGYKLNSF